MTRDIQETPSCVRWLNRNASKPSAKWSGKHIPGKRIKLRHLAGDHVAGEYTEMKVDPVQSEGIQQSNHVGSKSKTSHCMSTCHSILHAFLFCWWLDQGSLQEVHCCLTPKYYFVFKSTTGYYKVLLRTANYCQTPYYKLLQSSTPYYKVLHNTIPYYKAITKHSKAFLRTTHYCYVLLRRTQN